MSAGMGISLEQGLEAANPGCPKERRDLECQGHYPKLVLGLPLAQIKTSGVILRNA